MSKSPTVRPIPGYTLADVDAQFGDELGADVKWKSKPDLSAVAGRRIRIHFTLHDADLFAFCTTRAVEQIQSPCKIVQIETNYENIVNSKTETEAGGR